MRDLIRDPLQDFVAQSHHAPPVELLQEMGDIEVRVVAAAEDHQAQLEAQR